MPDGHRIPMSMEDWMRSAERRLTNVERAKSVGSLAATLGPGIAATTRQVIDWNAPENLLNGWYYSELGALNSPLAALRWFGITTTATIGYGTQQIWSFDDQPRQYMRTFIRSSLSEPGTFTPWTGVFNGDEPLSTDTAWTPFPFTNGWVNYASGFRVCEYRRVNGRTRLRGLAATGTMNATMGVLPAGFRPAAAEIFEVGMGEPGQRGRIDVNPDGNVIHRGAVNGYVSMAAIEFDADV